MQTINKRLEALEKRHETKSIMVLWGDMDDKTVCHIGGMMADETMPWDDAIARFQENHDLICVHYVEERRPL